MKKFILLLFIFVFYANSYSKTINSNNDIYWINGAQVFVLDEKYINNIDLFFKEIKDYGINTVFFRVFHNTDDRKHLNLPIKCESGVYFKTKHACIVNDLLKDVVKYAHKNNIKLYAWMATRSLSFLKTGDNISLSLNPEATNINNQNTIGYGANIFKKQVRDTFINLFTDLAKYDIDGILFQDDFIIKYTEGSDKYAATLFEKDTGIDMKKENFFGKIKEYNNRKLFSEYKDNFYIWAEWKSDQLALLFKELKQKATSINPKIKFAANIYYETPVDEKAALSWYSQNISKLKSAGADYFAVMGYSEQISAEQGLNKVDTAKFIGKIAENAVQIIGNENAVIMKLQSKYFEKKDKVDYNDYKLICDNIKQAGNISYTVVPVFSSSDIYTCQR